MYQSSSPYFRTIWKNSHGVPRACPATSTFLFFLLCPPVRRQVAKNSPPGPHGCHRGTCQVCSKNNDHQRDTMAGRNTCTLPPISGSTACPTFHRHSRSIFLSEADGCRLLARKAPSHGRLVQYASEYIGYSWVWCLHCRSHNSPVNSPGLLHLRGTRAGDIMWESRTERLRLKIGPRQRGSLW